MRAWCDRGTWRVVRGSGSIGAATSSLRTGGGDRIGRTRGFRAGRSAEGSGSEAAPDGFRREERLGCLARARDPLLIFARGVLLMLVVEQKFPDSLATHDIEASVETVGVAVNYARILHQKFAPKNFNPLKGLGFDPNILTSAFPNSNGSESHS